MSDTNNTTASFDALFQPAVKEKLKARIAIDGPTGAGKTFTALQWARILVGPNGRIGHIDTENRSAALYAPAPGEAVQRVNYWDAPYEFGHMPWGPPYEPTKLTDVIRAAADALGPDGCLIVDSFSHFWEGEGGTLAVVDAAAKRNRGGNKFVGWETATPIQRAMVDALIWAKCHVIVCMRSKMEYVLKETVDRDGTRRNTVEKIGMKPIQRDGVEYEFTVIADMDLEHRVMVTKSRCSAVADLVLERGQSAQLAQTFARWLASGVEFITDEQAAALVDAMNTVQNEEDRRVLKDAFVQTFGKPNRVTSDRAGEVVAWVRERVARLTADQPPQPPQSVGDDGESPTDSDAADVPRETDADPGRDEPGAGDEHDPDAERIAGKVRWIAMNYADRGITDRDVRLAETGGIVGRSIGSSNELSEDELDKVMEYLAAHPANKPAARGRGRGKAQQQQSEEPPVDPTDPGLFAEAGAS